MGAASGVPIPGWAPDPLLLCHLTRALLSFLGYSVHWPSYGAIACLPMHGQTSASAQGDRPGQTNLLARGVCSRALSLARPAAVARRRMPDKTWALDHAEGMITRLFSGPITLGGQGLQMVHLLSLLYCDC
jgi:hypothetical protein